MSVRNFSIIAHIDHGKSTLADRMVKFCNAVPERQLGENQFDTMDLERERGVTIKLKPVSFVHGDVQLNLIDTPGHVDFSYEVSRSLAAVEGALLVVDATQGIQAQTLAHYGVAHDLGLTIIPVVNKIDLPNAQVDAVRQEVADLLGCSLSDVLLVSAKTGDGIAGLVAAIIERIPAPQHGGEEYPRGLIFDAVFDEYRGVILYIRMMDGRLPKKGSIEFVATKARADIIGLGQFVRKNETVEQLTAGQIGYVVTGMKGLAGCHVGDTVTVAGSGATPLPGYHEPQPMVYASLFPAEGGDAHALRTALSKLQLNDAALQYEGERSGALGLGYRCGFLGLFHLEIVQERLRREYNQDLIVTVPSVAYLVQLTNGTEAVVRAALDFPDPSQIKAVQEPWVELRCVVPPTYLGSVLQLITERRGTVLGTEYLASGGSMERVIMTNTLPLSEVLTDFYDTMKSRTSGYASMYYLFSDYKAADIIKLTILIAGESAEALSALVVRDQAQGTARRILLALKEHVPREQFEIRLQAAIGGTVIAAERIAPLRKDVTAKLYGGDVTRKRKLLEKQKKGKKKMRERGRVALPTSAYLAVVRKRSD